MLVMSALIWPAELALKLRWVRLFSDVRKELTCWQVALDAVPVVGLAAGLVEWLVVGGLALGLELVVLELQAAMAAAAPAARTASLRPPRRPCD